MVSNPCVEVCDAIINIGKITDTREKQTKIRDGIFNKLGLTQLDVNDESDSHNRMTMLQTCLLNDKSYNCSIIRHFIFEIFNGLNINKCNIINEKDCDISFKYCNSCWMLLLYINNIIWEIYSTMLNNDEKILFENVLMSRLTIDLNELKIANNKTILHEFIKRLNFDCCDIILNHTRFYDINFNINTVTNNDKKTILNMCCDFDDTINLFKNTDNFKAEIDLKKQIRNELQIEHDSAQQSQKILDKEFDNIVSILARKPQLQKKNTKTNENNSNNMSTTIEKEDKLRQDIDAEGKKWGLKRPIVPLPPDLNEITINERYQIKLKEKFARSSDNSHIIINSIQQRKSLMQLVKWIVEFNYDNGINDQIETKLEDSMIIAARREHWYVIFI